MQTYICPAHDLNMERTVLGAMIRDNSRISLVRAILPKPEMFFTEDHQLVAGVIYRMADEAIAVDCTSLALELNKEPGLEQSQRSVIAFDLWQECPSPMNAEYYARQLSQLFADRQLQLAINATQRATQDRAGTVDERIDGLSARLKVIQDTRTGHSEFPDPICISNLPPTDGTQWIMTDFIARGMVTLFVALWKSGKTTWESILLRLMGHSEPSEFCGKYVTPGKAVVLTEEPSFIWEQRRDYQPLGENVYILGRHNIPAITGDSWPRLCKHIAAFAKKHDISLVVIDPLSSFWPVKDENDNAQVAQVFLAMREITKDNIAVLLLHHPAKSDAGVGKLSRGASSLSGAVDICIEMRRENEQTFSNRKRKIDWYGRLGNGQLMIELSEDARQYEVLGSPQEQMAEDRLTLIQSLLPNASPGVTPAEVQEVWPSQRKPRLQELRNTLYNFSDAQAKYPAKWHRDGSGKRGAPYRYWII